MGLLAASLGLVCLSVAVVLRCGVAAVLRCVGSFNAEHLLYCMQADLSHLGARL
jgi:hypothetical protein